MRNTSNLQNFKFGWWNKNKNQIETQIVCCWKSKMTQNTTTALQIQTTEENYSKIFFPQDFFFLQTNYICLFMCTVCVPITLKCALKLGLSFELGRVYMNWNEIHQNKINKVFVVVRVWECVFVWMFFFVFDSRTFFPILHINWISDQEAPNDVSFWFWFEVQEWTNRNCESYLKSTKLTILTLWISSKTNAHIEYKRTSNCFGNDSE